MARKKKPGFFKRLKRRITLHGKHFLNVLLGVILFAFLIGSAFSISMLFGISFIIAFAVIIYNGELKYKPWKPFVVFLGALIIRFALEKMFEPVRSARTITDLAVSAAVFVGILIIGWKIKKS